MSAQVRAIRRIWDNADSQIPTNGPYSIVSMVNNVPTFGDYRAHEFLGTKVYEVGDVLTIYTPEEFCAYSMEWVNGEPPEWADELEILNPEAEAQTLEREVIQVPTGYTRDQLLAAYGVSS